MGYTTALDDVWKCDNQCWIPMFDKRTMRLSTFTGSFGELSEWHACLGRGWTDSRSVPQCTYGMVASNASRARVGESDDRNQAQ
jgi:hypothetical protein